LVQKTSAKIKRYFLENAVFGPKNAVFKEHLHSKGSVRFFSVLPGKIPDRDLATTFYAVLP